MSTSLLGSVVKKLIERKKETFGDRVLRGRLERALSVTRARGRVYTPDIARNGAAELTLNRSGFKEWIDKGEKVE